MNKLKQKIKDFWWIFIEMGVPLREIRRIVFNEIEKQKRECREYDEKISKP